MYSNRSVDRIEFMLYPNGNECSYIYNQLRRLETFGRAYTWRNKYTTRAKVIVSTSPRINIFLQLGYAHHRNYVKIGWVLYGLAGDHKSHLYELLNDIVPGGAHTVISANVSYIEIAIDFTGISMENIEAFDTRLHDGYVRPLISRPKETIYCGCRNGIRRICIYDRQPRLRMRDIFLAEPTLRVEARLKFYGRDLALFDVPRIRNPFSSLYLVDFEQVASCFSSRRDSSFLNDAGRYGLNSALHWSANWDKKRRIDVMKRRTLCHFWDQEAAWHGIGVELAQVAPP
jgi:hypothetical protein